MFLLEQMDMWNIVSMSPWEGVYREHELCLCLGVLLALL
jgi:hypothetical protein